MTDAQQPIRVPRSLPRGRSSLPRDVVLVSQRARLIEAVIDVVAAKGYAASTITDIVRAAGVSRSTFYAQFIDKEECFIAAYQESSDAHLEYVLAETRQTAGTIDCLQAGVRAYLAVLSDQPAYAHTSLVEVLAAGPTAAAARVSVHGRYAALLRDWHGQVRAQNALVPLMPDEVFDCAVGGVADFVAHWVRSGNASQLPGLAPVIVTFLLNLAAVPAGRELAAALSASRARSS